MALVSMRQLLDHAAEHSYGLPAFNVNNLEQMRAIMEAADAVNAPVIVQASAGARKYAGAPFQQAAQASARHLDEVATPLLTPARFEQLASTFARACELEADFWQMGLQEA